VIRRRKTREVQVGGVTVGGDSPISVQSMTNTDTRDVSTTVRQIRKLCEAGCEIVRAAVPDMAAAKAISEIKRQISIPIAADIHYDYRLALEALRNGADKLRLNPGNIGDDENVRKVAAAAKERGVPIRVGVNSGSVDRRIYEKYGGVTAEALAESARNQIGILESLDFGDIMISVKASGVNLTVEAYGLIAEQTDYPLHIGITEAGTAFSGSVKSSVGIGILLDKGIGDTVRVSLTGDPVQEVRLAREILSALDIRKFGAEIVSCPTCGRTEIDLVRLAGEVEERCRDIKEHLKIAVMGCAVNGPGEAREADVGVAGGKGCGLIFKKGEIVRKVNEDEILDALMYEIDNLGQHNRFRER